MQTKKEILEALVKGVPGPGPEFMVLRDAIAKMAFAEWSGQNWTDEAMTEDERMASWAAVATTLSLFYEIGK